MKDKKELLKELILEEKDYKVSREELKQILTMLKEIDKKLKIADKKYSEFFEQLRKIRVEIYELEKMLEKEGLLL